MSKHKEAEMILGNMVVALHLLQNHAAFAALVPEVRVNLVYALPGAKTPQEVAAVEGRITTVNGMPHASGMPAFGASDHMARLIIEVRKFTEVNAGINFKYDSVLKEVVKTYCSEHGLSFGWIDRTKEPAEVAEQDRNSMPWKIKYLVTTFGTVPRVFYEGEGWGKEPLFVVLGKDAVEVATIAVEIAQRYQKV